MTLRIEGTPEEIAKMYSKLTNNSDIEEIAKALADHLSWIDLPGDPVYKERLQE